MSSVAAEPRWIMWVRLPETRPKLHRSTASHYNSPYDDNHPSNNNYLSYCSDYQMSAFTTKPRRLLWIRLREAGTKFHLTSACYYHNNAQNYSASGIFAPKYNYQENDHNHSPHDDYHSSNHYHLSNSPNYQVSAISTESRWQLRVRL